VVVFAAMLLSPLAGAITIAINLATLAFFGWLMLNGNLIPANPNASPNVLSDWFAAAGVLLMYGGVIVFGFYQLEKAFDQSQRETQTALNALTDERNNLEKRVAERTRKLRRVNEIGRAVTSILNPEELLRRAAFMIGDEFECYYTAIYMMDISGNWAELREATGEAGLVLRENKHRVDVNGKTAIAQSVRTRQARLYQDVGPDAVRFDFPLLPYTRTQLTLPLLVGDIAIGVIEMHSSFESAFAQQDLDTFQNMANEIAIAIENSRLFNEAQQSLAEMRATQRQYLHGAWSALTTDKPISYEVGDESAGGKPLETPLSLRDQVIGDIFMASGDDWTPEQRNLIDSIAIQAALALENARLVEESQSIATRERMANEIIAKVWSSNTLDSILQTTVRELGRALEAAEVDIELSMDVNNNE
jgi:GAF domain-containing protein